MLSNLKNISSLTQLSLKNPLSSIRGAIDQAKSSKSQNKNGHVFTRNFNTQLIKGLKESNAHKRQMVENAPDSQNRSVLLQSMIYKSLNEQASLETGKSKKKKLDSNFGLKIDKKDCLKNAPGKELDQSSANPRRFLEQKTSKRTPSCHQLSFNIHSSDTRLPSMMADFRDLQPCVSGRAKVVKTTKQTNHLQ